MSLFSILDKLPRGFRRKAMELVNQLPDENQRKLANAIITKELNKKAQLIVRGRENLDLVDGPVIFIANHLSNLDGVVLSKLLKKKFDPYFVAGVKLKNDPFTNFFKTMIRTIEIQPNSADLDSIKNIINTLKGGESIAMFPEGTRSRDGRMIEAKKGVTLIARLAKVPIVPIALMGTEIVVPVDKSGNMARERLYEGTVEVVIGKPFHLPRKRPGEDKHDYEERALNDLMNRIAVNLKDEYRGFYDGRLEEENGGRPASSEGGQE